MPLIGYLQSVQAFETLNEESLCSSKIKAPIDFVLKLKNSPQRTRNTSKLQVGD